MSDEKIKKVSIIVSKGSLDGIYPGLIMANGARMEGIEANLFFTFFGLYGVLTKYMNYDQDRHRRQPGDARPGRQGLPAARPGWAPSPACPPSPPR